MRVSAFRGIAALIVNSHHSFQLTRQSCFHPEPQATSVVSYTTQDYTLTLESSSEITYISETTRDDELTSNSAAAGSEGATGQGASDAGALQQDRQQTQDSGALKIPANLQNMSSQMKMLMAYYAEHAVFPKMCCLASKDFLLEHCNWHVSKAHKKAARWVMYLFIIWSAVLYDYFVSIASRDVRSVHEAVVYCLEALLRDTRR